MKKLVLGMVILGSVSSYAKINCTTVSENEVEYSCDMAYMSPTGQGFSLTTKGCVMDYQEKENGDSEIVFADYSKQDGIVITRSINDQTVEKKIISYKNESNQIQGKANLNNGMSILCIGESEI